MSSHYLEQAKHYITEVLQFRLSPESVNTIFFLMIATLPFVNRISKLVVVLYLLLFIRMVYRFKDFSFPRTHVWFLAALVVVVTIGIVANDIVLEGAKRVMYLMLFICLYYATIYFLQKSIISVKTIVFAIVVSMTIYMIDAYIQFLFGYDLLFHNAISQGGVNGVSKNRNLFALALFFYIAVLTYITIEHRKKYSMLLLVGGIGLIVLTLSRQIWLASVLFFLLVFFYRFKYIVTLEWKKVIVWGVLLSVFAWLLWSLPEVHQRIILMEQGYSSGRLDLWKVLLSHVSESPIWGHGLRSPLNISGTEKVYDYAHNLSIGILFNLGILGILLYIVFIVYFLSILLKCKNKQYQPYFIGMFIALIFVQQQLGGSMLIHKFIGPSIMIFLAIVTSQCANISVVKVAKNKHQEV